jgi:hypothetical protein
MMRRILFFTLVGSVLAGPVWCGPTPATPTEAPVQAVGDAYDFGTRSALDVSLVTHTFVLKAGMSGAVTVDRLQPSCHCTQAAPVGGTDGYGRFHIAAGKTAQVAVTFNPSDMAPGDVEKEVYVFVNGQSTPGVTLHIRGVITPPVVFSVPLLDFGRASVGEEHSLTLRIIYDQGLPGSGQTSPPTVGAAPTRELRYRITAPVGISPGKLSGTLFLSLTPADGAKAAPWSIPVRGEFFAPAVGR